MNRRDFVGALAVIAIAPTMVGRRMILSAPIPREVTFDWAIGNTIFVREPLETTTIVRLVNGREGFVYRGMIADGNGYRARFPGVLWLGAEAPKQIPVGKALIFTTWYSAGKYFAQWTIEA